MCGAMGVARSLMHKALGSEPLYNVIERDKTSARTPDATDIEPSFTLESHESKSKSELLYDSFFTKRGAELAAKRRTAADSFYRSLLTELKECYSFQKGELTT